MRARDIVAFHRPRRTSRHLPRRIAPLCCLALIGGCGLITLDGPGGIVDGNRDPTLSSAAGRTSGEPNDDFGEPLVAVFDAAHRARLQGVIATRDDIDVYELGPLSAGDRIVVDVDTSRLSSPLDSMIGLFDAGQNLFVENDDRPASLDAFIDETVRHDSAQCFLVVAASAFADRDRRTGTYRINVDITPDGDVPPPRGQTVFLNFDGGTVDAVNLGVTSVPPFDAAAIAPEYAGRDDVIKTAVVETFEENFDGFNITTVTSDDPQPPEPPFSTVLLGGFFPAGIEAFGISESVDRLNGNPEDVSIIFTEAFTPSVFSDTPSAQELGIAIGNIAAHEVGHLLGLNHVEDPTALMDAVSPADTFLEDQDFRRAPLFAPELFPLGFQDAVLLLSEIVGVF